MNKIDVSEIVEALVSRTKRRRTICETIRETFDVVYEMPESELKTTLTEKLAEILIYARKMAAKLHEYKEEWSLDFYEKNEDHSDDSKRRLERS